VTFGPYPAVVTREHDGDTCTLAIDLGFDVALTYNCRAFGINAPELRTPDGPVALDYAKSIMPIGTQVTVVSHGWDKYGGRFDGTITLPDGTEFGQRMLDAGEAVPE